MSSPQQPSFPEPPPGPPPAGSSPRRGKAGRIVGIAVLLLIVAVIAVVGWNARKSDPDAATTGDCVSRDGDSVKVVSCTDSSAAYKVVGRVENKTQVQFSINSGQICGQFPGAKSGFWRGEQGKAGYVLCLAPVK